MADVLSQSQIDALLKSMATTSAEEPAAATAVKDEKKKPETEQVKYSKYDFYSPRKFTKDKIKILTSVFENYARSLLHR